MWRKIYELSGVGRCALGAAGLYYALQRVQPAPAAFLKTEVRGGIYDRNPPKDPKAEIKFGNVGMGPMYIHEISILSHGKKVKSIEDILNNNDPIFEICSESIGMYKTLMVAKPFKSQSLIPLLTIRPKDESNTTFGEIFAKKLQENDVAIQVTFSASDNTFLDRLTKDTKVVAIVSK